MRVLRRGMSKELITVIKPLNAWTHRADETKKIKWMLSRRKDGKKERSKEDWEMPEM